MSAEDKHPGFAQVKKSQVPMRGTDPQGFTSQGVRGKPCTSIGLKLLNVKVMGNSILTSSTRDNGGRHNRVVFDSIVKAIKE